MKSKFKLKKKKKVWNDYWSALMDWQTNKIAKPAALI